jgi:hypothetical protein
MSDTFDRFTTDTPEGERLAERLRDQRVRVTLPSWTADDDPERSDSEVDTDA